MQIVTWFLTCLLFVQPAAAHDAGAAFAPVTAPAPAAAPPHAHGDDSPPILPLPHP